MTTEERMMPDPETLTPHDTVRDVGNSRYASHRVRLGASGQSRGRLTVECSHRS